MPVILAFSNEWLPQIQHDEDEYVYLQLAKHTSCAYLAKKNQ